MRKDGFDRAKEKGEAGGRTEPSVWDPFRSIFENLPHPYLILSSDLTIVGVNQAYLTATLARREAIVGTPMFEAFPDNPDWLHATGVRNLRASLTQVLSNARLHAMHIQRYDVRDSQGCFVERYWNPVNLPILDENGRPDLIIHHVEDVTGEVLGNLSANASDLRRLQILRRLSASCRILRQTNLQIDETREAIARSSAILNRQR